MMRISNLIFGVAMVAVAQDVPTSMQGIEASAGLSCKGPDWPCLSLKELATPSPKAGQVLVQIKGSSVNPFNIRLLKSPHLKGVIGTDFAGVVVASGGGDECSHLAVGDSVWTGSGKGAYAQYAVASCKSTGPKPQSLSFIDAGTLPTVAVAALQSWKKTGAPWANQTNLTVVITSGQGGTGVIGIQLAKALGAARVITAATGDGIPFVKKMGADMVVDYHEDEIFDALAENSVDIVWDNFGAKGTVEKAMRAIRPGGVYLVMLTGGGGTISLHPKKGVKQILFPFVDASNHTKGLDVLAKMFDAGTLFPVTQAAYGLNAIKDAFSQSLSGHVLGKLAVVP